MGVDEVVSLADNSVAAVVPSLLLEVEDVNLVVNKDHARKLEEDPGPVLTVLFSNSVLNSTFQLITLRLRVPTGLTRSG